MNGSGRDVVLIECLHFHVCVEESCHVPGIVLNSIASKEKKVEQEDTPKSRRSAT